MSTITNIILVLPAGEDEEERLADINEYFKKSPNTYNNKSGLALVDFEALNYGSYIDIVRPFECGLAVGAFNYLDLDTFIKHLKRIDWQNPCGVQLIIKEDGEKFRIIDLAIDQK